MRVTCRLAAGQPHGQLHIRHACVRTNRVHTVYGYIYTMPPLVAPRNPHTDTCHASVHQALGKCTQLHACAVPREVVPEQCTCCLDNGQASGTTQVKASGVWGSTGTKHLALRLDGPGKQCFLATTAEHLGTAVEEAYKREQKNSIDQQTKHGGPQPHTAW